MNAFTKAIGLAAGLSAMAAAASAEIGFSGTATLGYATGEADGGLSGAPDADATTLDAAGTVTFGAGFSADIGLSLGGLDLDGVDEDITTSHISIAPRYTFGNGFYAGIYGESAKLDLDIDDATVRSYGLMGGYAANGIDAGIYLGESETDPDLPSGVDVTDYGIGGSYLPMANLKIGGGLARTRIDADGQDVDLDMLKIGAAYAFNDAFTVFGGGAFGSQDDLDMDTTVLGVGVAYDLSTVSPLPLLASIEYANDEIEIGGEDGDYDVWKFGVTMSLGDKAGPIVPLNSVAASAFDPRANVLADTVLMAF